MCAYQAVPVPICLLLDRAKSRRTFFHRCLVWRQPRPPILRGVILLPVRKIRISHLSRGHFHRLLPPALCRELILWDLRILCREPYLLERRGSIPACTTREAASLCRRKPLLTRRWGCLIRRASVRVAAGQNRPNVVFLKQYVSGSAFSARAERATYIQ